MTTLLRAAHRWQAANLVKQIGGPVRHDILPDVQIRQVLRVRYDESWAPTPWIVERLPGAEEAAE